MHKIIIDIETTGLPKRPSNNTNDPSILSNYESARIVEVGYYIIDKDNIKVKEVEYIIKPNNFTIPEEVTKIHGISQELAIKNGISMSTALDLLYCHLTAYTCSTFISHNIEFDKNIILSECYRLNKNYLIEKIKSMDTFCTMKDNKIFNKWPKLNVLYQELFNKEIIVEHRALSDVEVCYKCYCELEKRNSNNYIVLRNDKRIKKN